ncbi:AraC family transcriptional regulator [Gammaproteobacteria bacterium 45_16_T64]|nr:AraC family transcriptional regulator [Gammaproteobacteria bacterium 45_16_T64]
MRDSGYASVPAVLQYLKMAETLGIECSSLLLKSGIDPELLKQPNKRVPGYQLEALLAEIIPQSGDRCFGIHTSQFVQPSSYSVLGYIAMNCSTVGEALAMVPVYEKIVGDMGVTTVCVVDGLTHIRWHCNFDNALVRRHVIDNVLASWTRYTRWISGENSSPIGVSFEHAEPANMESITEYDSVFGAPLKFNQPYSAIIADEEMLSHPIVQADPQLLMTLRDHATLILQEIDKDQALSYQVKNLLRLMMRQELPRKEVIAEQLGLTSRTLQRKLNEEGKGYQEILNELRLEMAIHYLENTQLSIDDIGARIGFAESRSFHRSFKQWTGKTPGSYRDKKGES